MEIFNLKRLIKYDKITLISPHSQRRIQVKKIEDLKIKIFADGAELEKMKKLYNEGIVKGFTTNPFFLKQAGVTDYETFIREAVNAMPDVPLNFEVISDDFNSMEREARKIAKMGENIYVKIPVTNTKGEFSTPLIKKLSEDGINLNITVLYSLEQIKSTAVALSPENKSIISIFAGRVAETGVDPVPIIKEAVEFLKSRSLSKVKVLWAATREVFNIFQAEECGCSIITVGYDILEKLNSIGKPLEESSLDLIKVFYDCAQRSRLKI
jgi:transaldolase